MQVNEHTKPRLHRKSNSVNLSVKDTQRDNSWEKEGSEHVGLAFFSPKRKGKQGYPRQTGISLKQAELCEVVIISRQQVMLDPARICMGQTLSQAQGRIWDWVAAVRANIPEAKQHFAGSAQLLLSA